MVGEFARAKRDRWCSATKYTMTARPGDPNSGGPIARAWAIRGRTRLARMQTDYIDLL